MIKLQHVPLDALIKINVSGAFLKRCQHLLLGLAQGTDPEELKKLYEKFAKTQDSPADLHEENLFILTAIVGEIEKSAINQNLVQTNEYTKEQVEQMLKDFS